MIPLLEWDGGEVSSQQSIPIGASYLSFDPSSANVAFPIQGPNNELVPKDFARIRAGPACLRPA